MRHPRRTRTVDPCRPTDDVEVAKAGILRYLAATNEEKYSFMVQDRVTSSRSWPTIIAMKDDEIAWPIDHNRLATLKELGGIKEVTVMCNPYYCTAQAFQNASDALVAEGKLVEAGGVYALTDKGREAAAAVPRITADHYKLLGHDSSIASGPPPKPRTYSLPEIEDALQRNHIPKKSISQVLEALRDLPERTTGGQSARR